MADEIKLLRPERLTDNPDGGGLATSTEIVDGQVNNLFDDVSRIDRVNGDVSLRKVFAIADTADASTFSGLHFIVQSNPTDPKVGAFVFRTSRSAWGDERADAASYIERYLDPSVVTRMIPYDRQLAGQRTVLVYQRPELELPSIGEVYVLANEAGTSMEYIRVSNVTHAVQTFTDDKGDFEARVITLTLTQALQSEWPGSNVVRTFTSDSGGTLLRASIISDAARYYGTVDLDVDADAADLTIQVGTVYGQLVPAATSEVAVTDATPGGAVVSLASSEDTVAIEYSLAFVGDYVMPTPIVPGSIIKHSGSGMTIADDGEGNLLYNSTPIATINYSTGEITRYPAGAAALFQIAYQPAVAIAQSALSYQQPISLSTRGFVYVASLIPTPAPGTLSVSYRANGRWYTLTDDGTGALVNETAGIGVGVINYATGTVNVTVGALPDIGSSVIYAWAQQAVYEIRTSDIAAQVPEVSLTLSEGNCEPSTVSVSWEAGGVTKTATDDGFGALSGDGTGRVIYGTGELALRPTLLPDSTTDFTIDYEAGTVQLEVFTPSKSGADITITAAAAPIRPRSVLITYSQTYQVGPYTRSTPQQLADNGIGQLVDANGAIKVGSSVNYTTGAITFNPDFTTTTASTISYLAFENMLPARAADPSMGYFASAAQFGRYPGATNTGTQSISFLNGSAVTLQYKADSATDTARTDTIAAPPLVIDMAKGTSNTVVPGGLMFALGGERFIDRAGRIVRDPSLTTGAGLDAGTINYSTGLVSLTSYPGGIAPALDVQACLTQALALPLAVATGRTPGSPIRPGSFFVQANRISDGALITAVADVNGNIDTTAMHGYIDVTTGVWSVAFGRYVLDSSLTLDDKAEPWYDVAAVDADGYIWRPAEVTPGTLRYSCVVQTTLPLDPAIIGVNPVRLPLDGRVQVIRAGDTLVIHDTQAEELAAPVAAGTETLPRTSLAGVVIYDANGLGVDPDLYSVDLSTGELTWADPLDLTGTTAPYTALHTVEDMALCTDAQITGQLTLAQPLMRSYTAGSALVSSAMVAGDVQARVGDLFAQNTWTNVWDDELIGSAPTSGATYNDVAYPPIVVNADCITQRWRIQFTSATAFNVVAEELGVVTTGNTSTLCAPINPSTGQPYFQIAAGGWGSGWATGNLLRFNTYAAGAPVWVGRIVQPGAATVTDDRIRLQARYDRS